MKAVLRRASPDLVADVLAYSDIALDRAAHKVTRADRDLRLGPTEYRMLLHMMENRGRVLSRQQLIDGVWGRDGDVDERTVDVHIGRLRKALVVEGEGDPIRTVRGGGYVFGER
jgi:two-component system phosphate regulon response regulator PhoB